jgi:capsule polysaccharide modification protein KpsS
VPHEEVRELSAPEREEVENFIHTFTTKARPVLDYQVSTVTPSKLRALGRAIAAHTIHEREHEYLWPAKWMLNPLRVRARRALSRPLYGELDPNRPFVYFPLHDAIDFKIERVIPHCANQEYLIRQVADSLPQGYDVVVKEHPYSIGQNPASMLYRLSRISNVKLVDPFTSSHELMKQAAAITVISSTVGIESLLYGKPVLTMGQPYYSGYGVTLDIDSFREIREAVPAVLSFRPDRERVLRFLHAGMRSTYDAAPEWLDHSDENAIKLAAALDEFAGRHVARPAAAQVAV